MVRVPQVSYSRLPQPHQHVLAHLPGEKAGGKQADTADAVSWCPLLTCGRASSQVRSAEAVFRCKSTVFEHNRGACGLLHSQQPSIARHANRSAPGARYARRPSRAMSLHSNTNIITEDVRAACSLLQLEASDMQSLAARRFMSPKSTDRGTEAAVSSSPGA